MRQQPDAKYLEKNLISNSAATSSLREYTGCKIFDSDISLIKRQIAFLQQKQYDLCTSQWYTLHSDSALRPVVDALN